MEEHAATALLDHEELAEHHAHDDQPTDPDPQATKPAEVPPLDYAQLRLLAECAVGMKKDDHVDFFFAEPEEPGVPGRKSRLRRHRKGRTLTNADVVVPASNPETRFPANRVTVSVSGGELSAGGSQSLVGIADAMFWSDAAVQKFVVPYLASCTGSGAVQALQLLQNAWNLYPADVAVYALAHVAAFEPGAELSLAKAFQVGFVKTADTGENPPLRWMPLDDFTAEYRPGHGVDPPKAPVPYHRGKSHLAPQHPDYRTLRAMAEYAASIRGPARYFLLRQDEGRPERRGFVGPFKFLPRVGFGDIVVPVRTPAVPEDRGNPGAVLFQPPEDVEPANLAKMNRKMDLPEHDAVFWSTGAIEQFLFPYYASKGGFASLVDLAKMYYVWTGKMPPQWTPPPTGQASFAMQTQAEEIPHGDEVFGLVHLYTSEWVANVEPTGAGGSGGDGTESPDETAEVMALKDRLEVGREIGVVHRHPDDPRTLQVKALHRFPQWHGAW